MMRRNGKSGDEIAAAIGRNREAVYTKLRRLGFKLTDEQRAAITANAMQKLVRSHLRPVQVDAVRSATLAFELAYCDWAERHGLAIHPYRVAA